MADTLASADGVFRQIVDESREIAIFLMDGSGLIETWNEGARLMFGFDAAEVVGRHFSITFVPEDRRDGVPDRELAAARETGRAEDARWHLRKDESRFFADGITTSIRDERGGLLGFVKFARDKTDRYRMQQRLAAQLALTNVLAEEQPFAVAAHRIMQVICENLQWDLGALWRVEEDGLHIRCADLWFASSIDEGVVRTICEQQVFEKGSGLPGLTWQSGEPVWVSSFQDLTRFPRASIAARAGLAAAFAFPIMHEGRVIGVMEFFSRHEKEPDQELMPVMSLIGAQIGDYIERRRTAQALQESEERYRVVSETARDAIFTIDADSTILFANAAVERLFGYKPADMIGNKLDMIIPERLRDRHHAGIARYLETHEKRVHWGGIELPAMHRDGHEIPVEVSFGEWTGKRGTIFTGFARDITERKRAAEAVQSALEHEQHARSEAEAAREQLERRAEEEASFRHLASALTGAVEMSDVLLEITNRATLVTRADGVYVERLTGASTSVEVVATVGRGAPPRGLRIPYPGSMTREIIAQGRPVILADMKSVGGSMAPYLTDTCPQCEVLVTPLIAEHEVLGALVLLNSRSSGRKFREQDLVRARTLGDLTSLALRRVRMMEAEREAKEKAEAAVRVRDETLGIVSHDLRNPLTKIALSADLLAGSEAGEQHDLIESIQSAARQMERLIQDLLDVARLESGRFSVEKHEIDAAAIVREACQSNEPLAHQKAQKIAAAIEEPLPAICADRDRLLQVFGNLIGNAIKFSPPRATITVEAKRRNGEVLFRIRDTGPGLPEADLKNLFRAYWQAKKTAHMGAGLGLAIVRGIVEAHGGKAGAENAPGGGAQFWFTIPAM